MHNKTELENLHVLTVKYIGQSNYLPARVKIISERFKQSVTFSYDSDGGDTLNQAEAWLIRNGHIVIGHGEGKGHFYVICRGVMGSFQPLTPKLVTCTLMDLLHKSVTGIRAQVTNPAHVSDDVPPMWRVLESIEDKRGFVTLHWHEETKEELTYTGCLKSMNDCRVQFTQSEYNRMLSQSK